MKYIVSGEKHTLLVSLSACPFTVMTRPGQKDTSNLIFYVHTDTFLMKRFGSQALATP